MRTTEGDRALLEMLDLRDDLIKRWKPVIEAAEALLANSLPIGMRQPPGYYPAWSDFRAAVEALQAARGK